MKEVAAETGWLDEITSAAVAEATIVTARETAIGTAIRLLGYGDTPEKIAEVTRLSIDEVMELEGTAVGAQ